MLRTGIVWRALPHDFPPWETVSYYFNTWRQYLAAGRGVGASPRRAAGAGPGHRRARGDAERGDPRQPVGQDDRKRGPRGFDAAQCVNGRKRHLLVDTWGLRLIVVGQAATIQESAGANLVLRRALGRFPRLRLIWADQGSKAPLVAWARAVGGWVVEIVARPKEQKGFAVLPRRWVVERTCAWLGRCRRLSKDSAGLLETHEPWVHLGMIHLMLKRLTRCVNRFSNRLSVAA